MERANHRPVDRFVVVGGVAVLGAIVIGLVASLRAPAPAPPVTRTDPHAATELVALLQAGEHAVYVGEYRFERTRADGSTLPATVYEGHGPHASLSRSGSALTIDTADARFDCETIDGTASCFKHPPVKALAESAVVRVAADAAYDVTGLADATIAGEAARCFALTARTATRQLPDFGPRAEMCLATDGVPLRTTTTGAGVRDERTALQIVRRWDHAALVPALAGFEAATPPVGR